MPLPTPGPGRVVRHEAGHLGEREDEDEVEEELERRDRVLDSSPSISGSTSRGSAASMPG